MFGDKVTSIVRTVTPMIAGGIITFLANKGFSLDATITANVYASVQMVVSALYYIIVRSLEAKFPKIGILLGSVKTPQYTSTDQ